MQIVATLTSLPAGWKRSAGRSAAQNRIEQRVVAAGVHVSRLLVDEWRWHFLSACSGKVIGHSANVPHLCWSFGLVCRFLFDCCEIAKQLLFLVWREAKILKNMSFFDLKFVKAFDNAIKKLTLYFNIIQGQLNFYNFCSICNLIPQTQLIPSLFVYIPKILLALRWGNSSICGRRQCSIGTKGHVCGRGEESTHLAKIWHRGAGNHCSKSTATTFWRIHYGTLALLITSKCRLLGHLVYAWFPYVFIGLQLI